MSLWPLWPVNSSALWKYRLGGGFKYLFILTPKPGEMIQFRGPP